MSDALPSTHIRRFMALWDSGVPDLDTFLAGHPPLAPTALAALVGIDQHRRWQRSQRVPAEDYLARFPCLAVHPEAAIDLIYGEFLLREQRGERPSVDDFAARFPEHAAAL